MSVLEKEIGNKSIHKRISTDTMRSTTSACFAALVICTANLSSDLASAQNIAGKFAARTKLTDTSSSNKKRRSFWGSRNTNVVEDDEEKDGECSWTKEGIRNCWWWHLFLAESEMIIKSIGISVVCALISWLWYLRSEYYVAEEQDVKEENKGGKFLNPLLSLAANTVHSSLPLSSLYICS